MNCPKCAKQLFSTTVRGTEVDQCKSCGGIWFDESELETILELKPSELKPLRKGRHQSDLNVVKGKCPRDDNDLLRVCSARNSAIVVDTCLECRGIWLDGGEFDRLLG